MKILNFIIDNYKKWNFDMCTCIHKGFDENIEIKILISSEFYGIIS
jgi:hypothetical protein